MAMTIIIMGIQNFHLRWKEKANYGRGDGWDNWELGVTFAFGLD
jgi:hypothetical protein